MHMIGQYHATNRLLLHYLPIHSHLLLYLFKLLYLLVRLLLFLLLVYWWARPQLRSQTLLTLEHIVLATSYHILLRVGPKL